VESSDKNPPSCASSMTTLGKKLVEKNSVNEGDFVTENVWEDVVTAPSEAESSTPLTCEPKKKRVKTTASRKTQAPAHLQRPEEPLRDEPPTVVPTAGDGADRDDDTVGYEDEAPPRAAPSLLASFDAAAASSSEDEEEEETSGQWPKSQYHGVTTTGNSSKNPWRATTRIRGKPVNLGSHATEEEAARVYDKYIREHNLLGTNRRSLNFPLPGEEEAKKPPEKPHARPGSSTKPAARKKPSVTEQLATARSERDAVRLERDTLRAGRETVASERDALRVELDALRSESAAAVSERNALRAVLDAACAERDALRSERDVLQGENAATSRFNDKLLAKLGPVDA